MRFVRLAIATCFVLLAATAAVAQTGGLTIKVVDLDGNPLPTALVTITNDKGFIKETTEQANLKGFVDFPVLSPGSGYSITVTFPGMATVVMPDLFVKLGQNQVIPVTMQEEFVEKINVTARADVIDLEKQESSTRFSDDFISDLPIAGRFYTSVLTLAPGVNDADGDGNPTVHGSRARDLNVTVNGVSNTDPLTGQQLSRVNTNSIEEMEVITAGAGVEFGRAQGGFSRIIQKQGSNTHEGIVEFFYRTSKLDGDGANKESDRNTPKFDSFQPSVQFSGPIIKDTLWYRASYDIIDDEVPTNVNNGIVIQTRNRETRDLQLTWQVSPRNKVQGSYRSDPDEATNVGVSSTTPEESTQTFEQDSATYAVRWTAPYSPKVLVDTTVAWTEQNQVFAPSRTNVANSCVPTANQSFLRLANCFDSTQGVSSGSSNVRTDDDRTRFTMRTQANIFGGRFWGMSHQFKLGFDVENERYFQDLTLGPSLNYQVISFTDEDDTGQNPGGEGDQPSLQSFALVNAQIFVPDNDDLRATGTNWAFYAEDQFKPMQNMTITAGVRVDRAEISSEGRENFDPVAEYNAYAAPIQASIDAGDAPELTATYVDQWPLYYTGYESIGQFKSQLAEATCAGFEGTDLSNCITQVSSSVLSQGTDDLAANVRRAQNIQINNTNFSPNLAISYSPWANNKTVFRASAGRFYNTIPLIVPLQELIPVNTVTQYRASLQDPDTCPPPDPNDPMPPIVACGQVVGEAISPLLSLSTVDRNIKTPYQDEFTFKVERQLWAETSVSLQYIKRSFRDQIQDENINLAVGDLGQCFRATQPNQEAIVPSQGASTKSCSDLSGTACVFDSDCAGGATCGYFEDVVGDWLQDPYSMVVYPDTDPGPGDGFVDPITGVTDDNCVGELEVLDTGDGSEPPCDPATDPVCSNVFRAERPDKLSDLYLQNPFWSDIFLIGNYNSSDYEAFVLEFVRRQYRSWEMNGSYTWSESKGDGEDFFQALGDDPSLRNNVFGFSSDDRTHVVKLNGTAITPWGVRLGTTVQWQSGLPYSLLLQDFSRDSQTPFNKPFFGEGSRTRQKYITGVRNDQRNDSYWNIDLSVKKELRLAKNMNLQLTAEVFNVLADDTYIVYNTATQSGFQVNGVDNAFSRFGRSWQVGGKLAF